MLLLLVEYRADAAVVGVIRITVQLRHILLLFAGIADYQRPFANPGLRRALGVPAVEVSAALQLQRQEMDVFKASEAATPIYWPVLDSLQNISCPTVE
nr:hypothetical protein [Serratia marcescens]